MLLGKRNPAGDYTYQVKNLCAPKCDMWYQDGDGYIEENVVVLPYLSHRVGGVL